MPSADYESELGIVIGKHCKDVSEEQAMDYVLGYTGTSRLRLAPLSDIAGRDHVELIPTILCRIATNDISSRKTQFETSQWCRSKSYDKACPMGELSAIELASRHPFCVLTRIANRSLHRLDSNNN